MGRDQKTGERRHGAEQYLGLASCFLQLICCLVPKESILYPSPFSDCHRQEMAVLGSSSGPELSKCCEKGHSKVLSSCCFSIHFQGGKQGAVTAWPCILRGQRVEVSCGWNSTRHIQRSNNSFSTPGTADINGYKAFLSGEALAQGA